MKRTVTLLVLLCSGCVMGIPDYYPPPKPPKPCNVVVIQGDHGVCLTQEEFQRWARRNLP